MRDAVLWNLAGLPDIEVMTCVDARLALPDYGDELVQVGTQDNVWDTWKGCVSKVDAVWPIAPETGGALYRVSEMINQQGKKLLGCSLEAVSLAGSKLATYRHLRKAGVRIVPTFMLTELPKNMPGPWVAKPDDGAGCEASGYFDGTQALLDWMHGREATHVIQPFRPGDPASISLFCRSGQAWLLSCNRQKVDRRSGRFIYSGSVLNAMAEHWSEFNRVACQVARAVPGLAGYVGIDVLVDGPQIEVLEINPRLTTSYAGLHQAIGQNPARPILDLFYNDQFELPPIARNTVEISFNAD